MVWALLDQDFIDVKNKKGEVLYRYKSCVDEFPYTIEYEDCEEKIKLTEKRIITFNPSLAKKKQCEINKMVDKALALRLSEAKMDAYV